MHVEHIELLYSIPEHADYAAEPGELDPEDVPPERLEGIKALLAHPDGVLRFEAAKLLTYWGFQEGLDALVTSMEQPEVIEGRYIHRLHGYDDTYYHILNALLRYRAILHDRGERDLASAQIHGLVAKIIEQSNHKEFQIGALLGWMARGDFLEFLPLIKNHLESIIDDPEKHHWKIKDAIDLLLTLDPVFVKKLLKSKKKKVLDFDFSRKQKSVWEKILSLFS